MLYFGLSTDYQLSTDSNQKQTVWREKEPKKKQKKKSQVMQPCIIVSAFGPDQMKPSTDVGETLSCGRDSGGQRRRRKGKKNSNINNEVKETVAAAAVVGRRRRKQRRS